MNERDALLMTDVDDTAAAGGEHEPSQTIAGDLLRICRAGLRSVERAD